MFPYMRISFKTAYGLSELLSNLHLNSHAIRLALYFYEAVRSGFYRPIYEALRLICLGRIRHS